MFLRSCLRARSQWKAQWMGQSVARSRWIPSLTIHTDRPDRTPLTASDVPDGAADRSQVKLMTSKLSEDPAASSSSPTLKSRPAQMDSRAYRVVTEALKWHSVVVFMKGTPEQPMCGFSRLVVQVLDYHGVPFHHINVLEDDDVRQGIKFYGNWPTIPQVYVDGELVGGADILRGLHEAGEVKQTFSSALQSTSSSSSTSS